MFGLGKIGLHQPLSCLLSENGYSLVSLNKQQILFCESHDFKEGSQNQVANYLTEDIKKHHLVGRPCQIILSPGLYQLLLVDAPDVPEKELPKALRWQLKGLIDYPINDTVVDAFLVPPHGAGERRKKAFAAVTLSSALNNKISILESCLLKVSGISISELALSTLLSLEEVFTESPSIVISFDNAICQYHLFFKGDLYFFRNLPMDKTIIEPQSSTNDNMLLEIQRSIDYCLMELKLPEPQQIFFTPNFYKATALVAYLQTELNREVKILDINSYFNSEPIAPEIMAQAFYAVGGALMLLNGKSE